MHAPPTARYENGIRSARIVMSVALVTSVFTLLPDAFDSTALQWPVLTLGAALAWAITTIAVARSEAFTLTQTRADVPVVMTVIAVFASALVRWSPGVSGSTALASAACALCFFGGTNFVTGMDGVDRSLRTIVVAVVLVTVIGFLQYAVPQLLPIDFHLTAGMRPLATFGNSIVLSAYLAIAIPPMVALRMRCGTAERRWLTVILLAALTLLVLTRTRSSMIALAIAMIVLASLRRETRKSAFLVLLAVIFGGLTTLAFLEPVPARQPTGLFVGNDHSSIARRLDLWVAAVRAIGDSPFTGHGVGRTADVLPAYRNPDYWISGSEDIVRHVHNEPLQIGVDLGMIGLVIAGLLVYSVMRPAIRAAAAMDPDIGLTAAGILAGMSAGLVDSFASPSLHQAPLAGLVAFFGGVLLSPALSAEARTSTLHLDRWRFAGWIASAGLLTLAAISAGTLRSTAAKERLMNAGVAAEAVGNDSAAAVLYTDACRTIPTDRLALFNAARLSLRSGQPERALQIIDLLHRNSPDFPKSHALEAKALMLLGQQDRALEAARREAQLRNHPEVYFLEARIHDLRGEPGLERTALLESLNAMTRGKLPYRLPAVCSRLLALSSGSGQFRELRDSLSSAGRSLPDDPTIAQTLRTVDSVLAVR